MTQFRNAATAAAMLALVASCSESPTTPNVRTDAQSVIASAPGGLIHLWSGDGNALDVVGAAHGRLGADTRFEFGINGQAFSFGGQQTAIVGLPVDIGPAAFPQLTMGMWVKLRGVANAQGWVLGHDDGGYDRSLALTDGRYGYGFAGGTGTDPHFSGLLVFAENLETWHCVAAAYDADAGTAMFYADGATQTVDAWPDEGAPRASLGGLANFANHTIDGLVDEVFMYDRVLSGLELNDVCSAMSGPQFTKFRIEIATLWPVNNKQVTVVRGISASHPRDLTPAITVQVTANEAITASDWAVVRNPDGTVDVQVRARRTGAGTDRTYTITATATTNFGSRTSVEGTVTVPHDLGRH